MKKSDKPEALKKLLTELQGFLVRHSSSHAPYIDDLVEQLKGSTGESIEQQYRQYRQVARSYWQVCTHKNGFGDYCVTKLDWTPDFSENEKLDRLRDELWKLIGDDHFAEGQLIGDDWSVLD
jgi:hypothetical protein